MVRQVTNHWLAFFTLFEAAFANQVIRIATATTTANAIAVDHVQPYCIVNLRVNYLHERPVRDTKNDRYVTASNGQKRLISLVSRSYLV